MMPKLLQDLSFPAIMAGFITCMIGISVSAVLVIEAAQSTKIYSNNIIFLKKNVKYTQCFCFIGVF